MCKMAHGSLIYCKCKKILICGPLKYSKGKVIKTIWRSGKNHGHEQILTVCVPADAVRWFVNLQHRRKINTLKRFTLLPPIKQSET